MVQFHLLNRENLIIDYRARDWCKLPYPDHPNGCPNYGVKPSCPPNAQLISDFIDFRKGMWLVVIEFNLKAYVDRMKTKHAKWTERQARCVLYWQPKVNKELRIACEKFSKTLDCPVYTTCPEAMGVNVIQTAKTMGLQIHSRPKDIVYKIGLVGYSK